MSAQHYNPLYLQDAEEQLQSFRALKIREADMNQLPPQPGAIPADAYQRAYTTKKDLLPEKLDAYARMDIQNLEISPEFRGLPNILSDVKASNHDFEDGSLMNMEAIEAMMVSDASIVRLGRAVMPMFSSGFSRRGAASLFILAHHTKKPGSDYKSLLFQGIVELNLATDTPYTSFPENYTAVDNYVENVIARGPPQIEAAYYSYIATSALRLFTKSSENFARAWNHILSGFSKFYKDTPDIRIPPASENAVESLSNIFSIVTRMKMSLYRILYVANQGESNEGLKRFMYDMHLSNTGLHIVSIFTGLVRTLNCSPGLLLEVIKTPLFQDQIDALGDVINLMASKDARHSRRMWRYGRLFDEAFMSELQTKKCPFLVYILAAALQMKDLDTHKDILKISQLRDVNPENQKKAKKVAEKLIKMVSELGSC